MCIHYHIWHIYDLICRVHYLRRTYGLLNSCDMPHLRYHMYIHPDKIFLSSSVSFDSTYILWFDLSLYLFIYCIFVIDKMFYLPNIDYNLGSTAGPPWKRASSMKTEQYRVWYSVGKFRNSTPAKFWYDVFTSSYISRILYLWHNSLN